MGSDSFSWIIPDLVGGMARPGWALPLDEDLAELRDQFGIGVLISLTERPLDAQVVTDAGMDYHHLPIPDFRPPTPATIDRAVQVVRDARNDGTAVAVHCAAGVGRTGTILACVLVAHGHDPDAAIDLVRELRPGSIETPEQE
ncbi:MAG: dual specificity protein phosphatase family protein, partial [Planctomycetota bacterium]